MTSFVFPMAGLGKRVRRLGPFKPGIKIEGLTIFEWNLLGLSDFLSTDDSLFIVRREPEAKDQFFEHTGQFLSRFHKNLSLQQKITDHLPRGPADSAYQLREMIPSNDEVIVINPDQIVRFERPSKESWDIFAPGFVHSSPGHSRIETSSSQPSQIVGMSENGSGTCIASCGVYGFKVASEMVTMLRNTIEQSQAQEIFFSDLFHNFARSVDAQLTGASIKIDLGTEANITKFRIFASAARKSLESPSLT